MRLVLVAALIVFGILLVGYAFGQLLTAYLAGLGLSQ